MGRYYSAKYICVVSCVVWDKRIYIYSGLRYHDDMMKEEI